MQTRPLYREIDFANNFAAVQSKDELKALIDSLYESDAEIGLDIETGYSGSDRESLAVNMYHPDQFIAGLSITNDTTWARYVPLKHDFTDNLDPNFVWSELQPLLESKAIVAHNLSFEAENLRQLDRKGDGPNINLFSGGAHDSMIEAYVLSDIPPMPLNGAAVDGEYIRRFIPPFHQTEDGWQNVDPEKGGSKAYQINLKSLTNFRYNYKQANIMSLFNTDKKLTAKQERCIRFNALPIDPKTVHYACDDAYLCLQLHRDQYARILEDPYLPKVYALEMKVLEILVDMRDQGICVDWEGIEKNAEIYKTFEHALKVGTREKFEQETGRDLVTLNFNSPKQIAELVYGSKEEGGMGLAAERTTATGAPSTDDKALTSLRKQSPAIDSLLRYRQCLKMGKWFEQWVDLKSNAYDQKIHPSFIQVRVQSGRFASAGPNVQQITKRWWYQSAPGSVADVMKKGEVGKDYWTGNARDFIIPSPGYRILSFDYKSAEIQMMAALSQEKAIIEAFYSGEDFHKWTASVVFGKPIGEVTKQERQAAKSVAFGIIFGQSESAMAQQLGISKKAAIEIREKYFSRFPQLADYLEKQHKMVQETNEVRTWLGRKATVWESMHEKPAVQSKADRMSINIPVQGGATGDYTKMAMVRVADALKKRGWWGNEVRMIMNQHDSLVFEVSEELDLQEVTEFMDPLVEFSLAGAQGTFNQFESFPPMSVDWEAGKTWGSVTDVKDVEVLNKTTLDIELSPGVTNEDLQTIQDVLATNPGPAKVLIRKGDVEYYSKSTVKVHPDVAYKVMKGDPDIGITHNTDGRVTAKFI